MSDAMDLYLPRKKMEQESSAWMCDMELINGISYLILGNVVYFKMWAPTGIHA